MKRGSAAPWLKVCLVIVPSVSLFAMGEFVAWIADAPQLSQNKFFQRHEFRRDCRARERPIARRCDPANFSEAPEVTSVYVFGGSSVQGHPVGVTTPFATYMQEELSAHAPGNFAIHNLGVACRDSIYVRKDFNPGISSSHAYINTQIRSDVLRSIDPTEVG